MVSTKKAIAIVRRARNESRMRNNMDNISRMERYGVNVNNTNNTIAKKIKLLKLMSEKNKAILAKFTDPYLSNIHLEKRKRVITELPKWFKGDPQITYTFYNVYLKPVYNAYVKKFAKKYSVSENLIRSVNLGAVLSRGGQSVYLKAMKKNYPQFLRHYLASRWKRGTQRRIGARQRLESGNMPSLRRLPPNVTKKILTLSRVNPSLMNNNYMSSSNRYRQRMFANRDE